MSLPSPDDVASAVDTHCHLFLMEESPEDVVLSASEAGVDRLICVGVDVETSNRSVELARQFADVFATAGVHPHTASDFDRNARAAIEALASESVVVGIGETGLDYYRQLSPPEDQHRAFRVHIAVSAESGKPLVVHVREAWDDAMRILEEEGAERVVLHCFSGDQSLAKEAATRGYFVSFAGNVTYPNAGVLRDAAGVVPADQILCETDSPFLTPQAVRGRTNSPANLPLTLAVLADVRDVSVAELTAATAAAAESVFGLPA
ncbi:MAG TPA: TatD family hydrolase [Actinomycetota bacterium]|nr:TatD family hydrolase [Actinomycetota bacterium]